MNNALKLTGLCYDLNGVGAPQLNAVFARQERERPPRKLALVSTGSTSAARRLPPTMLVLQATCRLATRSLPSRESPHRIAEATVPACGLSDCPLSPGTSGVARRLHSVQSGGRRRATFTTRTAFESPASSVATRVRPARPCAPTQRCEHPSLNPVRANNALKLTGLCYDLE